MKIRAGFVSNSSSSSFIAIGVKLTKEEIASLQKIADEHEEYDGSLGELFYEEFNDRTEGVQVLQGSEDGVKGNDVVVANIIEESGSDDYFESKELSIDEIKNMKMSDATVEKFKNFGIDIRSKEPKIFIGTRAC